MSDEELENLAEEANLTGDRNLAVILFAFLGARKCHMDDALARRTADWARKRAKELEQFKNKSNN